MTNVRKHADATVVRVDVTSNGDLRMPVIDNGRGFRPELSSAASASTACDSELPSSAPH